MPSQKYVWSKEEITILKKFGSSLHLSSLLEKLPNKSRDSIYKQKRKLGIKSADLKKFIWTKKENEILSKYGSSVSASEIHKKIPNKPIFEIYRQRNKLRIKSPYIDVWSKKEIETLKEKGPKYKAKDLIKFFKNKSELQISRMRKKLGIKISKSLIYGSETKQELKIIKDNILKEDKDIAKLLVNRTPRFVAYTRLKHGLNKRNIFQPFPKEFNKWFVSKLNNNKSLDDFIYKSTSKELIVLQCPNNKKHILTRKIASVFGTFERYKKINCLYCKGNLVHPEESLFNKFPILSKYFDEKKNKISAKKVWHRSVNKHFFVCNKGHSSKISVFSLTHKQIGGRTDKKTHDIRKDRDYECPICNFVSVFDDKKMLKYIDTSKHSLEELKKIPHHSIKDKLWFKCDKVSTHTYQLNPSNILIRLRDRGDFKCSFCIGTKVDNQSNSLTFKLSGSNVYYDKKKNKENPDRIYYKNIQKTFYFFCDKGHEFKIKPSNLFRRNEKAKCVICDNQGWTRTYLKSFLRSIIPILPSMTQSERWVFFQQSGILDSTKRNIAFAKQVITQKFPLNEIEKFIEDEPSLVDDILDDPTITSNDYLDSKTDIEIEQDITQRIQNFDGVIEQTEEKLPEIKSKDVLKSLDQITSSQFCDKEAIEFLIISKKEKLWRDVFERGVIAVSEIRKASGNEYVKRAQSEFLFEYDHTAKLKSPKNFTARTNDGSLIKPNLMQFLTTTRLDYNSRIGNWSGTGAGKTLSAILASRLLDMKFTIVTCPNSVVTNWQDNIKNAFKDSEVLDKSELPDKINPKKYNYLVLNYEYFQQPTSSLNVKKLLSLGKISFIVIDEVHYTKQRELDNVSKRKEMIKNLVVEAGKRNEHLKVIGMSATPVINNLFEGRSMIELITGKEHKDIDTTVNVNNCMYLFQKLSTIGTRYLPQYQVGIKEKNHYIDCSDVVEEIREKGANRISVLDLELILTRKRIPEIIKHIEKKTVIYTHYIKGIGELLAEAISNEGYTVGFYTGEDKSGLTSFVKGNTDVLIGTSAIGTGVDGLQDVCRKLIFNVLPWTNAEYEQIKGRIFRQGQKQDVEFILPLTKAEVNGQEWSWCKTKLDRIHYKKTVADASVDGVIPEEHIRSEHQVLQDLMKWLDRLSNNGVETFERKELASTLFTEDEKELRRRKINHGDFTKINKRWNSSRSGITHKRLQKDSSEWVHYHEEYRKAREDWAVTPYKEMIKFYAKRDGLVIGDFGCGEGFLHKELSRKHTVHSFDHVAMEKFVTECDFSKTPLDEESLDVTIFCLSMMGSNIDEYLLEAHRVLRLDGKINIIEATSRFKDIEQFKLQLQDFGFDNVVSKDMWKFTHIVAEKSDRVIKKDAKIKF